ncbi:hypothetical protein DSO57_1006368 [Entomophthora muscae]|uniref:Uncharacterized protein n=1 Tax=Entomophthora muscae TaxID=34485 RepID=A0ACC2SWN2_9FUNG|nr:hypothetical protein DSO57_1006368 [Entomophthora muscae]
MDISGHPRAVYKLRKACEQAKCLLASSSLVQINVDSLFNNIDLCSEISCDEFDALCRDLVASCMRCIESLLIDTNLAPQQIDEVVLTGGSSRMKKVQCSISKLFGGKDLKRSFSMNEAAARGAAIYASQTRGRISTQKGGLATDVTPFSLGIEVPDDCMEVVVPKNTPIPATISKEFTTVYDNQKSVVCAIYEGEHISTKKNIFLGSFTLGNIQRAKRGVPALQVTFNIDMDGI